MGVCMWIYCVSFPLFGLDAILFSVYLIWMDASGRERSLPSFFSPSFPVSIINTHSHSYLYAVCLVRANTSNAIILGPGDTRDSALWVYLCVCVCGCIHVSA